jgi:hypothetical protein
MNPISKFGIYLVLAGVLAVLFAVFPGSRQPVIAPKEPSPRLEKAGGPIKAEKSQSSRADNKIQPAPAPTLAAVVTSPASTAVRIPAIRGVTNYGWVQLPYGTQVDFVQAAGDHLWVRWDGCVVQVPQVAASRGAVVVRKASRTSPKS